MPWLRAQRWRWKRSADPHAHLLEAWSADSNRRADSVDEASFLVVDAEMSGLDPESAELLSLGWVRVSSCEIQLASAQHHLIRNRDTVGQSATVHQLRDCELEGADGLLPAMDALLKAASGCVLVFHHAALDMAFLNKASLRLYGAPLLLRHIDTLLMEHKLLNRREHAIGKGDLTLAACRDRYGLPHHRGHNALTDAVATAELLLAHIVQRGAGLRLKDL